MPSLTSARLTQLPHCATVATRACVTAAGPLQSRRLSRWTGAGKTARDGTRLEHDEHDDEARDEGEEAFEDRRERVELEAPRRLLVVRQRTDPYTTRNLSGRYVCVVKM